MKGRYTLKIIILVIVISAYGPDIYQFILNAILVKNWFILTPILIVLAINEIMGMVAWADLSNYIKNLSKSWDKQKEALTFFGFDPQNTSETAIEEFVLKTDSFFSKYKPWKFFSIINWIVVWIIWTIRAIVTGYKTTCDIADKYLTI